MRFVKPVTQHVAVAIACHYFPVCYSDILNMFGKLYYTFKYAIADKSSHLNLSKSHQQLKDV